MCIRDSDGDAPSMSPRDKWSEHAGSPGRTARSGAVTIAPGATTVHVCDAKRCTRVVERRGGGGSERTTCAVHNCRDSRVYVLADVTVCSVVGCVDCVVVVGACATVLRAVACERVKIVCAAGRVVLRNCLGCDVLAYTPAPILLAGDARSCRVGPFGLCYPGLERDVAAAGLDGGDANLWRHPLLVSAVAKAPFASHTAPDALPVPPAEFDVVRGPRRGAGDGGAPRVPFGLPAEYAAAVDARDARAAEVRRKAVSWKVARTPPIRYAAPPPGVSQPSLDSSWWWMEGSVERGGVDGVGHSGHGDSMVVVIVCGAASGMSV